MLYGTLNFIRVQNKLINNMNVLQQGKKNGSMNSLKLIKDEGAIAKNQVYLVYLLF